MHYDEVVRSYLTKLLGPDRARPATQRALGELAALSGTTGRLEPDLAAVRRVAHRAGLEALVVEPRGGSGRIRWSAADRRQCAALARRLRERAEGRISATALDSFYRHLERCQSCAAIAARFEASEWYLETELASVRPLATAEPTVVEPLDEPLPEAVGSSPPVSQVAVDPPAEAPSGLWPERLVPPPEWAL